jgi:hypothetical protein
MSVFIHSAVFDDFISFVGLCFWHPDLSSDDQKAMKAAWDKRSAYPAGMRKLSLSKLAQEKAWRSKTKAAIIKSIGGKKAGTISADYISLEIRASRRAEREELKAQIRSLLMNDTTTRKTGPRKTGRVKNRTKISSLAKKWRDLDTM